MLATLVLTNNVVLVSYVESLLREARIASVVLDRNLSGLHGAVGLVPQRILVDKDDWAAARMLLVDAGLAAWIVDPEEA